MYKRHYHLTCEGKPNMERFRIVGTQGLTFKQLMKKYNVNQPGFVEAFDDFFDNTRWEITSIWENKESWEQAQKNAFTKMFWNRFEMQAFKHELKRVVIDGDSGESYEPFAID